MCGARAAFAHINSLIAVIAGAKLVACAIVLPNGFLDRAGGIPSAKEILMVPYVAAPLLLLLTHLGVTALHVGPRKARVLLMIYAVCSVVFALSAGGFLGWAGSQLANWLLENPEQTMLLMDGNPELRAWFYPIMKLAFRDHFPEESVRPDVAAVLAVCGATLLLLVVNAALAVAARPRRMRDDEHALRPCSSLYYEPSAPAYKAPLQDSIAWQ